MGLHIITAYAKSLHTFKRKKIDGISADPLAYFYEGFFTLFHFDCGVLDGSSDGVGSR